MLPDPSAPACLLHQLRQRSPAPMSVKASRSSLRTSSSLARIASVSALTVLSLLSMHCGHPATEKECEEIVDKIVELELRAQNVKDEATIAQRKIDARAARGKELLAQCQGRKVTEAAMTCVRNATTYEQIENQCLR